MRTRSQLRTANDILDAITQEISYQKARKFYNCFIIETDDDLPGIDKSSDYKAHGTIRLEYVARPEWNVIIANADVDGQGTTSMKYFRWNLRNKATGETLFVYTNARLGTVDVFVLLDGKVYKWSIVNEEYQEEGIYIKSSSIPQSRQESSGYTLKVLVGSQIYDWDVEQNKYVSIGRAYEARSVLPTTQLKGDLNAGYIFGTEYTKCSKYVIKVNYASSPQSHKIGSTLLYNELYRKCVEGGELTNYAVKEEPFLMFHYQPSKDQYTFIGLGTGGYDKGDPQFFQSPYKKGLTMEGKNHDPKGCIFQAMWDKDVYVAHDAIKDDDCLYWDDPQGVKSWEIAKDKLGGDMQTNQDYQWKPLYDLVFACSPYLDTTVRSSVPSEVVKDSGGNILQVIVGNDVYGWSTTQGYIKMGPETEYFTEVTTIPTTEQVDEGGHSLEVIYHSSIYKWNGTRYAASGCMSRGKTLTERIAYFRANNGKIQLTASYIFLHCILQLIGASDNYAKNFYPGLAKKLELGGRWEYRQDDLDSIFDTDNNGKATKSYTIEFLSKTSSGGYIFQGAPSALAQLMYLAYPDEIKQMHHKIFDELAAMGSGSTVHERVFDALATFYFRNAQDYFPVRAYCADFMYKYVPAWETQKTYNDVRPIEQALGDRLDQEKTWLENRILYLMSKYEYGGFHGSSDDGYGAFEFRPAESGSITLTLAKTFYPNINQGGGVNYRPAEQLVQAHTQATISYDATSGTTLYVKALDMIESLGDLSNIRIFEQGEGGAVVMGFSGAKLRDIQLGGTNPRTNVTALELGYLPCLEYLDAHNVTTLNQNIMLQGSPRCRYIHVNGTAVPMVISTAGSQLSSLKLSDVATHVCINKLPQLTDENLSVTNWSNVRYLLVRDSSVSALGLLRKWYQANGGTKYCLAQKYLGLSWQGVVNGTKDDILMLLDVLTSTGANQVFNITGADDSTIATTQAPPTISGAIHFQSITQSAMDRLVRYSGNQLVVTADTVLDGYTLTPVCDPVTGGTIEASQTHFDEDDEFMLKAIPAEGHRFLRWEFSDGRESSTNNPYEGVIHSDLTVTAKFKMSDFQVTANVQNATVEGVGGYDSGETCVLKVTAAAGYRIKSITYLGVTKNEPYDVFTDTISFTVTSNVTVSVVMQQVFTVQGSIEGGLNSAGQVYVARNESGLADQKVSILIDAGSTAYFNAVPNTGYKFRKWMSGEVTPITSQVITETTDKKVEITAIEEYSIAVLTEGQGTASGGGTYIEDTTCSLTAVPAAGWKFSAWYEGEILVDKSPTISFQVTKSRTLVAKFEEALRDTYGAVYCADGTIIAPKLAIDKTTVEELIIPEGKVPIGLIIVPESHTDDGTIRIMSLNSMDPANPETGASSETSIKWGGSNDIIRLIGKKYIPTLAGNSRSDAGLGSVTNYNGSLPNVLDEADGLYYSGSTKSTSCPPPFIEGGKLNTAYKKKIHDYDPEAGESTEVSATYDYNGTYNTDVLTSLATAQSGWLTDATITNSSDAGYYPAACCCRRYHTQGTSAGDWYLPASGELGYIIYNLKLLNNILEKIPGAVQLSTSTRYWASTVYSTAQARCINTSEGYLTKNDKSGSTFPAYARAFLSV